VSPTVVLGLVLAVATALSAAIGMLMKHRGAAESPAVELRRPIRTSLALFRSRWYTLGILVAFASWGFHVSALALAPISLAQSVIAGGLVLLTVAADRLFHLRVSRREWAGVILAAAGLAALTATLEDGGRSAHSDHAGETLAVYVGAAALAGIFAAVWSRRGSGGGPLLGVSAGLLWGASDVSIKALSDSLDDDGVAVLVHPLAFVILAASLVGLTVSARSLQLGPPVAVIALTGVAANACTILSGPVVFQEPLPDDTAGLLVRFVAFALVIAAAALTPPPAPAEAHRE
jgi:multidrug transporter EmrE-like cation transporter